MVNLNIMQAAESLLRYTILMKESVVILDNVRSAYNVGAILRTCDAAGITRVIAVGFTPHLAQPNDERPGYAIDRAEKLLAKTALGAEQSLQFDYASTLTQAIQALQTDGYNIYALEQSDDSHNLLDFTPQHPWALVVGHEREGVQNLDLMDATLEIPMRGSKESLNVSVATGIALYRLMY
jgi:tRNA G18 (ribose-2'-O)-methylase SpoU